MTLILPLELTLAFVLLLIIGVVGQPLTSWEISITVEKAHRNCRRYLSNYAVSCTTT